MPKSFVQPTRQAVIWTTSFCLLILALIVTACGGAGSPATSSSSSNTSSGNVVTITITEKAGGHDIYAFDPQTMTIKAGTTVKWVNNSDENHLLASTPSGVFSSSSIVPRSGSTDNTFHMTFSTAGTYTYTSTLVQRQNNQPEGATSSATGTITVTA
ncbi:MAG TPA: plastocyanin/azurin family copper-binding protein [Ktedonobacteraceae bacterium]|nr:plastocyanin/azurin family copper-binding protein [Ktedonobacteraceae bacterium]